jgi:hypothetical protein
MTTKFGAVGVWILLLAAGAATIPAPASARETTAGASMLERWSAGAVSRGTGYGRAGGSERVREVQRLLRQQRYVPGPIDGLFGPRTERAVVLFQVAEGLTVDGIVGSQTLTRLRRQARQVVNQQSARDGRPKPSGTVRADRPASERPPATGKQQSGSPKASDRATVEPVLVDRQQPVPGQPESDRGMETWLIVVVLVVTLANVFLAGQLYGAARLRDDQVGAVIIPVGEPVWVEGMNPDLGSEALKGRAIALATGRAANAVRPGAHSAYLVDDPRTAAPVWVAESDVTRRVSDWSAPETITANAQLSQRERLGLGRLERSGRFSRAPWRGGAERVGGRQSPADESGEDAEGTPR